MSVSNHDIALNSAGVPPCPNPAKFERMAKVMDLWWQGWSMRRIADQLGVSRARIRAMLNRVGCDERLRTPERRNHVDSRRPIPAGCLNDAVALMAHPKALRLTPRQLAAAIWTSQCLCSRDVARRMGVYPQRVRMLLIGAKYRLARFDRRSIDTSNGSPAIDLDWGNTLTDLLQPTDFLDPT